MVRNTSLKRRWMEHNINLQKREAWIEKGYETLNVWECTNDDCQETMDDIRTSPADKITKCPNCNNKEWRIITISRPVKRIVWE
jgi:hypothetical protein